MSIQKIITNSAKQTRKISQDLAIEILKLKHNENALVLALSGELGAGKTTFLQGFAKGLGINEKINSPTFVIMKRFKIYDLRFKNFYHFDCYRLENEKDLESLGFKEIISNSKNIVAIEWPEKIKKVLPPKTILIKFKHLEEKSPLLVSLRRDGVEASKREISISL